MRLLLRLLPFLICLSSLYAQVGPGSQINCSTNISVTPALRGEGYAERTGEIILICTGGTPTASGAGVPTVDITLYYNAQVTSRLYANTWSEALLIVDEPGSGLAGTSSQQLACADPNGICTITGTGTGNGTYDGTAGRPNVFQGQVTGNL